MTPLARAIAMDRFRALLAARPAALARAAATAITGPPPPPPQKPTDS